MPRSSWVLAGRAIDLAAGVLRDPDGVPIALRPQAWALLCVLVRHGGSVVTKATLFDAVWPGQVVSDASLARAISDLRAAFGGEGHQVIKTVARRGYLLVAPAAGTSLAPPEMPLAPLPVRAGPLFGRDAELAELGSLLSRHRLVSVVGAGGIGKTALAITAARSHGELSASSTAWVDLARLADPALLVAAIAGALGLPIAQHGEQLPALLAALQPIKVLLVLDNAEHLVAAVSRLARAMLDAAPGLVLLVTSQVPLHIEHEQLFRLGALALPAEGATLAEAAASGALALFADQARAQDRHFALSAANLGAAIQLCRRLDGLPLAIRLAAARLPLLGLAGVVSRLDEKLQLLASNSRDAPPRQQTLLAALDWSYGLLAPQQQDLFRRLGIFVGGFSLELAVALARCAGIAEWTLIEGLNLLVEHNLIDTDHADPPRYRMLETQRDYAVRLLRDSSEFMATCRDHAQALDKVMRRSADQLWELPDAVWLPRWAPELDNLRLALDWSAAHDVGLFASLAGSAAALFRLLDLAYEMRRRAAAVAAEALDSVADEAALRYWLARRLLETGVAAGSANDFAARAETLARRLGDRRSLYLALCHRVSGSLLALDNTQAIEQEIAALQCSSWPPRLRANGSLAAFVAHGVRGQWREALHAAESGYALTLEAGTTLMQGALANGILVALMSQGHVQAALQRSRALRSVVLAGPVGSAIPFVGTTARCALLSGDLGAARRQLAQLCDMCRMVDWIYFDHFCSLYVSLALAEGRADDAARLMGYSESLGRRGARAPWLLAALNEASAALAQALEPTLLEKLLAEGAGLSREAACAVVLKQAVPDARRRQSALALTVRQAEVLRLVAQGQTDKQVARTLGLSPRTVEMHVARAMESLRCRSRSEAVRSAAEQGLLD